MSTKNLDVARAAWGSELAVWIILLANECDRTSQGKAAARIRYSITVVSQVLACKYGGNYAAIEQAVRGALLNEKVICPVLGEIAAHACMDHQRKPFATTNPVRVQVFKACRGIGRPICEHSLVPHLTKEKP
jgi:hypothetical protein